MASGNRYSDLITAPSFNLLMGSAITRPITTSSGMQTKVKRTVFFTARRKAVLVKIVW